MTDHSKVSAPLWDVLPLNSHLVSLLPVDDVLRFAPASLRRDLSESLRIAGAAWLLWAQQQQRRRSQSDGGRHGTTLVYILFVMDWAPTIYRIAGEQFHKLQGSYPRNIPPSPEPFMDARQSVAVARRQQVWKIVQSIWPLLRLGLWLRLATSTGVDDGNAAGRTATLYPVYGYRRWMHDHAMELWPVLVKPLLDSSRETRQWIRHLIRQLLMKSQAT